MTAFGRAAGMRPCFVWSNIWVACMGQRTSIGIAGPRVPTKATYWRHDQWHSLDVWKQWQHISSWGTVSRQEEAFGAWSLSSWFTVLENSLFISENSMTLTHPFISFNLKPRDNFKLVLDKNKLPVAPLTVLPDLIFRANTATFLSPSVILHPDTEGLVA